MFAKITQATRGLPSYENGFDRLIATGAVPPCRASGSPNWPQHGHRTVTQGGPRRIWDQIEQSAALWFQLGRPRTDRFGLTVTTDQQRLWLDGTVVDQR